MAIFKDTRIVDARLHDEKDALLVVLKDGPVEVRFEHVSDERRKRARKNRRREWKLAETVDYRDERHAETLEECEVDLDDDTIHQLCEGLYHNAYGKYWYDQNGDRIPTWDPGVEYPDDDLLEEHTEYVREVIQEVYEDDKRRRENLLETYNLGVEQEGEP